MEQLQSHKTKRHPPRNKNCIMGPNIKGEHENNAM